jgi:hypothetical protein
MIRENPDSLCKCVNNVNFLQNLVTLVREYRYRFRIYNEIVSTINIRYMKKNEKNTVVNNQEDEDGYTLYPGYAIYSGNIKEKPRVRALHKDANTARNSSKPGVGNLTISDSAKPGIDKK